MFARRREAVATHDNIGGEKKKGTWHRNQGTAPREKRRMDYCGSRRALGVFTVKRELTRRVATSREKRKREVKGGIERRERERGY